MAIHTASTFEVRLDDPLNSSRILEETLPEPGQGEVVLEVERFGLTSNNLTYALLGNDTPTRYWDVFPAEAGWGRVPAWGSARVIDGDESVARKGERFVGLLPMADRFVFAGRRTDDGLLTSSAPGRSDMPSTYSGMRGVTDEVASRDASERANILLQPFYSFAALLTRRVVDGGEQTAVVSSASSKAGLLVGRLFRRRGLRTVGLTAQSRRTVTESTGAFTEVKSYDDISQLTADAPTVLIDIAGNPEVSKAVAESLSDNLTGVIIVGATHYEALSAGGTENSSAADIEMFDTAQHEARYADQYGAAALLTLEDDARRALLPWASQWVRVEEVDGIDNLKEAWQKLQQPPSSPLHGTVVSASPH